MQYVIFTFKNNNLYLTISLLSNCIQHVVIGASSITLAPPVIINSIKDKQNTKYSHSKEQQFKQFLSFVVINLLQ